MFVSPRNQKTARKLFQHAPGKNVGERSYDTCHVLFYACLPKIFLKRLNVDATSLRARDIFVLNKYFELCCLEFVAELVREGRDGASIS